MSPFEACLLALVQGVTEFLPISSSAHLILLPYLLGWGEHDVTFDIVTNTGTLLAAVVYFRRDLGALGRRAVSRARLAAPPAPLLSALALGTLPILLAGLLLYDLFTGPARSPAVIAFASIFFGLLLFWADRRGRRHRDLASIRPLDGLWIGLAQAVALVPGTSRSGITMTAGLWRGLTREEAARFSFLLAIPAGAMALAKNLLEAYSGTVPEQDWAVLALAFAVAGLSAYAAIGWLLAWLARQSMTPFVIYRILLGLAILVVAAGR